MNHKRFIDIRWDRNYYLCNCLNEWNEVSFSQYFSVNTIVGVWIGSLHPSNTKVHTRHGQQGQRSDIESWSNWEKKREQYKNWQNGTQRTKSKLVRTANLEESLCGWVFLTIWNMSAIVSFQTEKGRACKCVWEYRKKVKPWLDDGNVLLWLTSPSSPASC